MSIELPHAILVEYDVFGQCKVLFFFGDLTMRMLTIALMLAGFSFAVAPQVGFACEGKKEAAADCGCKSGKKCSCGDNCKCGKSEKKDESKGGCNKEKK